MGCFSFLCSECGDPINSNSFSGEHCILFLLEKGEVREWMQGEYDSYGQVFTTASELNQRPERGQDAWDIPGQRAVGALDSQEWQSMGWGEVCELMFNADPASGIAAYHSECWQSDNYHGGTPEISDSDPDQGWREYRHPVKGPKFRHETTEQETAWTTVKMP